MPSLQHSAASETWALLWPMSPYLLEGSFLPFILKEVGLFPAGETYKLLQRNRLGPSLSHMACFVNSTPQHSLPTSLFRRNSIPKDAVSYFWCLLMGWVSAMFTGWGFDLNPEPSEYFIVNSYSNASSLLLYLPEIKLRTSSLGSNHCYSLSHLAGPQTDFFFKGHNLLLKNCLLNFVLKKMK